VVIVVFYSMAQKTRGTMATMVMKFGGTSVGSPEAIKSATAIVRKYTRGRNDVVVVVSAMSGVTNTLIRCAEAATQGDMDTCQNLIADLQNRHYETVSALFTDTGERTELEKMIDAFIAELSAYSRSIHVLGEVTPRGMDTITSLGERINARLVAAVLGRSGVRSQAVDAMDLIVTDANYQNAIPLMKETRAKTQAYLAPLLAQKVVPVVTGFVAATAKGIITTLGRGGSDYTAAILGDCLDAAEVLTWTDVDGVMTADPRVVPEARAIPEISFNEVSELAYFGAKVLHPKTIRPIMSRDIPLWVKNTFNPDAPGTRITQTISAIAGKVTAISIIRDLSMVTVEGRGMLGVPGIAARTFSAVAKVGASVLMISQASSEQSICFIIPTDTTERVTHSLEKEMSLELSRRDIDRVWAQDEIVIVTAVGAGLRHTPGISARIFGALGRSGINVIAIAQGSSEYSISIVVTAQDGDEAVRQIHQEVIINGND
jgi:aspartate kinase